MNTTSRSIGRLAVLTLAGLVLAGCRTPSPAPSRVDVQLGDEETYRQFWLHAIRSVRHFGYDLDRADPAAGVITSKPLTSKQWFEFWRNDTLDAGQIAEASLHTIRRQIRLDVQPTPTREAYLVSAVVNVEREELPDRQVTTPANVMQAFNPRSSMAAAAQGGTHWVDLGRDPVLEAALIRQVARWPGAQIIVASDNIPPAATQPAEPPPAPAPAAE